MNMNMNDETTSMMLEKSWDKVPGHLAPATAFILFGSYALFKSLQLYKEVPAGMTFAQMHIPYRDLDLVRKIGIFVMAVSVSGACYHAAGEGIDTSIFLHMTLYASFFMVGLASFLESKKLLVPDSGRCALALTYFLTSFVWRAHGMAMMAPVNRNVHVYEGYINFVSGLVMSYSIIRKESTMAHVIAWAMMVLQGFWLYFIAFYLCCMEIDEDQLEPYLCLMAIFLVIVISLVIAISNLPQVREAHDSIALDGRGQYEVLTKFQNGDDRASSGSQGTVESHEDEAC